ncbi:MAG: undecaprenyl-phosphate glucose phosphotransferase [bacterium]|nr:undecaprenyl-phosphate glucose phosphotransferase [bacterium]
MLYRYSEVFRTLVGVADLCLIAGAWLAAYALRFHSGLPVDRGVPELAVYLQALVPILPVWFVLFHTQGVYEPQRMRSLLQEAGTILRVTAMAVLSLVALNFFAGGYFYSRGVVGLFSVLAPLSVIALRVSVRGALRSLRRRGYNQRYVLVVGGGPLAAEVIDRIRHQPGAGLRVRGVLAEGACGAETLAGVPIIGNYAALKALVRDPSARVDQVILALGHDETAALEKVLAELDDEVVNVNLVPDLLHVMTLRSSIENLDGLPVINLRETPLVGWGAIGKRLFDVVAGSAALVVFSPLMLLICGAIRATSGGPVLFVQQRMGLDGCVFPMFKFRSMVDGAERASGPVWTAPGDPRRTPLGEFLRRFSLDELPQLWNVIRGDMSLVGPRPERPVFIEQFRGEIPGYMLRHKAKAGMTGWAQVHGWRGSTSLDERIEHDLYYIQNWSIGLDVRIMIMTMWRGLFSSNAY